MGHNVGKAAERAVQNSQRTTAAELTPEQLISELRKNVKALLFVPTHQIEALLAEYDKVQQHIQNLEAEDQRKAFTIQTQYELIGTHVEEKKTMTDTILGLTQKVQEEKGIY